MQDRENVIKALAHVRKTGKVNMRDRYGVLDLMEELGYHQERLYITEFKESYLDLLDDLMENY